MPDVLPWDVAMNNRDRSDVGLWISYKRFDEALDQARTDERERIIEGLRMVADNVLKPSEYCMGYIQAMNDIKDDSLPNASRFIFGG